MRDAEPALARQIARGSALRDARARARLSLEEASSLIGRGVGELEAYEEGLAPIPPGELRALTVEYQLAGLAKPEEAGKSGLRKPRDVSVRNGETVNQHAPSPKYADVASIEHRKRFGQFFTPPNVAALMADWAVRDTNLRVLDPALGTGVLAAACLQKDPTTRVTGYEKDAFVLGFAPQSLRDRIALVHGDFLSSPVSDPFDAVIMNPPYIRHREIEEKEPFRTEIGRAAGCEIPTSANLYVYFLLKCISLMPSAGRLSVLIPSEWMSANFSGNLKRFLVDRKLIRHIVTFSNCSNVFDDALTTASVLMLEVP